MTSLYSFKNISGFHNDEGVIYTLLTLLNCVGSHCNLLSYHFKYISAEHSNWLFIISILVNESKAISTSMLNFDSLFLVNYTLGS